MVAVSIGSLDADANGRRFAPRGDIAATADGGHGHHG